MDLQKNQPVSSMHFFIATRLFINVTGCSFASCFDIGIEGRFEHAPLAVLILSLSFHQCDPSQTGIPL